MIWEIFVSSQAASQPPSPIAQPQVSYTCSFCNTKQTSQEVLIKHLSQHVNFGGTVPNSGDIEKGYMSFKTPSVVQTGMWKTKFMCLSCGKMFGKEGQVKIHLNVHYGDNIYNCRFCEKVFANYMTFEVSFFFQFIHKFFKQRTRSQIAYVFGDPGRFLGRQSARSHKP